jgi:hypothetical protein
MTRLLLVVLLALAVLAIASQSWTRLPLLLPLVGPLFICLGTKDRRRQIFARGKSRRT